MAMAHLAVSSALVTTLAGAAPGYGRADLRHDLDAIVQAGATGIQARVTGQNGSLVATAGLADLRTKRPVPPDGYFRIGSANKAFVATVVLQLQAEGKLSLADTADRWLPGLIRGHGNDGRKITVRQLLQHTSGLVDD